MLTTSNLIIFLYLTCNDLYLRLTTTFIVLLTKTNYTKRKHPVRRIILRIVAVFFIILMAGGVILYYNLNRILTNALNKSFNSNTLSDVYELKFERLSVNFFIGNVSVYDVELLQREKPLQDYPYINSSLHLKTRKMMLENVQLLTLIKSNILELDKIEIIEPDVDFRIEDKVPVFFPFKDTTVVQGQEEKNKKRSIESFALKEFDMVDASFHTNNSAKEREFHIKKLGISLRDMLIDQRPGRDFLSYKHVELSIGEFSGSLQKKAIKYINFKKFKINIDSLHMEQSADTTIYHFADFTTGLKELDIQTADSLFHVTMQSFNLSYRDKSIQLMDVAYKPNVSEARLQAAHKYQNTQFSGTVGNLNLAGVNFDSLIYKRKIFIDEITLDKVSAIIFKDKTKPVDKNHFPQYLGQSVKAIRPSLLIKRVKATNVDLVNRERNPDSSYATANINRATVEVKNITNLSGSGSLLLNAGAYIENKAPFSLSLVFQYREPQFSFNGKIEKFNLQDLNPLIQAYTPASINKGVVDELSFSGNAYRANATGTLKFLYHDLDIDIDLRGKAKWKSAVLAFGANTILPSSNPGSSTMPPRIVNFHADRDMNKSFVNLTIKSILAGLKETMIMSKENRKAYRKEKKEAKKEKKQNKK